MNETSHLNIGKVQSAKEMHRPLKEVSIEPVDGSSAEGSIKRKEDKTGLFTRGKQQACM